VGQWCQLETGLHQNWIRDYDPTTGRYLQADPLGLIDGPSVYGYVYQNPGRYVDPRGEFGVPGALAGALIGGIVGYYQTGCWQGALAGATIGGVAGGLGTPLSSGLGGNSIAAGLITGTGATAASQLVNNEIGELCGCDGERVPILALISSPEFWFANILGGFGGSMGGAVNGPSSIVGGWTGGSFGRQVFSRSLYGGTSAGTRDLISGGD